MINNDNTTTTNNNNMIIMPAVAWPRGVTVSTPGSESSEHTTIYYTILCYAILY